VRTRPQLHPQDALKLRNSKHLLTPVSTCGLSFVHRSVHAPHVAFSGLSTELSTSGESAFPRKCPQTEDGCSESAFATRAFQRAVEMCTRKERIVERWSSERGPGRIAEPCRGKQSQTRANRGDERHVFGAEWQISRPQESIRAVLRVPRMIATRQLRDNGIRKVIHRFHKRESCVFHSIHRLGASFRSEWNKPLTSEYVEMERVFDGPAPEQLATVRYPTTDLASCLTRRERHAYTRRALRRIRRASRRNNCEAYIPA